jgi:polyisoprenoid-binding protein YceI
MVFSSGALISQTPDPESSPVSLSEGTVAFEVATNVFSTRVRGTSSAVTGGTRLQETVASLRLEKLEAAVPVASLKTGIRLRDEHMRKYIFQTPDGQVPDVRFTAEAVDCPRAESSNVYTCPLSGSLTVRGTSRPFAITLKATRHADSFRVAGDAKLALSAYEIERPSQFGVRTDDEVRIHLEFSVRKRAGT